MKRDYAEASMSQVIFTTMPLQSHLKREGWHEGRLAGGLPLLVFLLHSRLLRDAEGTSG